MISSLGQEFVLSLSVGFLGGLASGVGIYIVRQKRRADRLRKAISMEVRQTPLDSYMTVQMGEMGLNTPIIDANLDKIHLLTEDEIVEVENFHRHMKQVQEHYEIIEGEDGNEQAHIPSQLQSDSSTYADNTVKELEAHIWSLERLISKFK